MIRVQVAHPTGLFSSALVVLLREQEDFDVFRGPADAVAEDPGWADVWVTDAEEFLPRPAPSHAACLPGSAGLLGLPATAPDAPRDAARPADPTRPKGAGLLVLAAPHRPGVLRRAFDAGALGYVDKGGSPERLAAGIRAVARGERYVDVSLAVGLLHATEIPLTPRELSVLALAAAGSGVGEIALSLHLSRGTVRNYLAAAIRKTGARNRVDAIRIAHGAGWV
ncbi:response regulator transcription factor [Streptomyces sp. NBC_00237]|uniref:response regulator transcription factor n=1 Tax=Streptomyces sp. NBC_00237 TaxID=2975687 RepID=UPI00225B1C26|nr:response regulator transcription factor [Streptomyces sp. NBC_00237]MCX5205484.1 response regulator transcription factor [Streptomyces sp. NBC_00237]